MDMKDLEKMAGSVNIDINEVGKMAKGFGIDDQKSAQLLGMLGQMDPAQMTQIMAMLSALDVSSLDMNALAQQFGVPAEAIEGFLKMIKK